MAFHSLSVGILLLTVFLISLPHFNNASFVDYACGKAADPRSASANLNGLIQITFNLAIKNVTRTLSHVKYLLSKPADARIQRDLRVCQDSYSGAKDDLFDAVSRRKAGDVWSTLMSMSAAMTEFDTCQEDISTPILDKPNADGQQFCAMLFNFMNKDLFH